MERTMFDGNLLLTIEELTGTLNKTIEQSYHADMQRIQAEYDYQILLRQKALIEKDKGVSITFIDKFLRGDEEVAELRKKRDIAEALYETYKEKINAIKLQIRVLDAQAGREWSTRQSDY